MPLSQPPVPSEDLLQFKLNSILEVTKAINNNVSTSELVGLFKTILQNRLEVERCQVFIQNHNTWSSLLCYGMPHSHPEPLSFEPDLLSFTEITSLAYRTIALKTYFEVLIPVFHKTHAIAYVLLGDSDRERFELSPVIKHLPFIQTLANIISVAIENKRLFKDTLETAKYQQELNLARDVQNMLIPQHIFQKEGLEVAARYLPHDRIGGDYFDFIPLNAYEYIFCIADVSGKGIAAALLMSNIQATLHTLCQYTHNLKDIILELNKRVIQHTQNQKFVSFFIGKINMRSQQLTYINAGHNPPLLVYDQQFTLLEHGCTLLGITEHLMHRIEVKMIHYAGTFRLLCYTDGISESFQNDALGLSIHDMNAH
jgi:sigma-B regulation protein RsbU (phosphoserine phosphatase)